MAVEPRFAFCERVVVATSDPAKAVINGEFGAVLGRAYADDGQWTYAVSIYKDRVSWSCWENELRTTGEFDRRETFFDGSSMRISQDGELLTLDDIDEQQIDKSKTTCCVECQSSYFSASSHMTELCPECAHHLYGKPACIHAFEDGRCSQCGWDGSHSDYVRQLIQAAAAE